jgi:hypothetical protein
VAPRPWHEIVEPGWAKALEPVAGGIAEMGDFLRAEIAAGRTYLPAGPNVLRAFQQPFDDVRVLIVGQDPYPTPGHAEVGYRIRGRRHTVGQALLEAVSCSWGAALFGRVPVRGTWPLGARRPEPTVRCGVSSPRHLTLFSVNLPHCGEVFRDTSCQ